MEFDLRQRLVGERGDITKLGWPVALPRFTRRPSDSSMIFLPSGKVIMVDLRLDLRPT
jgi:hypothetical protein